MNIKKLATIAGVGLGLSLASGHASALSIDRFQDDSIDFVLTTANTGSTQTYDINGTTYYIKSTGAIGLGDVLISTFEVPTATVGPYPGTSTTSLIPAGMEMTGISVIQVNATPTGGLGFSAFSEGLNAIIGLGSNPGCLTPACGAGGGAMIALYLNSALIEGEANTPAFPDINAVFDSGLNVASNCTSLAACINQVTYPTLFQVDGLTGNPDESWTYVGTNAIGTVASTGPGQTLGVFNINLGTFFNANGPVGYQYVSSGLPCNGDGTPGPGCVQFQATGNLRGGLGLVNGAVAHDDFTGQKYISDVPEPAAMALLGMGLLGFATSRRRI